MDKVLLKNFSEEKFIIPVAKDHPNYDFFKKAEDLFVNTVKFYSIPKFYTIENIYNTPQEEINDFLKIDYDKNFKTIFYLRSLFPNLSFKKLVEIKEESEYNFLDIFNYEKTSTYKTKETYNKFDNQLFSYKGTIFDDNNFGLILELWFILKEYFVEKDLSKVFSKIDRRHYIFPIIKNNRNSLLNKFLYSINVDTSDSKIIYNFFKLVKLLFNSFSHEEIKGFSSEELIINYQVLASNIQLSDNNEINKKFFINNIETLNNKYKLLNFSSFSSGSFEFFEGSSLKLIKCLNIFNNNEEAKGDILSFNEKDIIFNIDFNNLFRRNIPNFSYDFIFISLINLIYKNLGVKHLQNFLQTIEQEKESYYSKNLNYILFYIDFYLKDDGKILEAINNKLFLSLVENRY